MGTLFAVLLASVTASAPEAKAHNVVVVVIDGLRPREVFDGAERALMHDVECEEGLVSKYWRPTVEARRAALMPFVWGQLAAGGQVFGNAQLGSPMKVTNAKRLSYPGYNELFTGVADPRITSNAFADNPNVTVLEALAPSLARGVQVFATWETFFRIFNVSRSHLDVHAGWQAPFEHDAKRTAGKDAIDALHVLTTPIFGGNALDAFSVMALKESLKEQRPNLIFLGLGETDEWQHAGRYDMTLEAIHRADAAIGELWATLQSLPEYRDSTTLLVTTDHGRGTTGRGWREHGADVAGSEDVWLAALGAGVPALGERSQVGTTTQSQVAATIAELLGSSWRADAGRAISFEPPVGAMASRLRTP